jgi:hypothetical protein
MHFSVLPKKWLSLEELERSSFYQNQPLIMFAMTVTPA